jgi:hypothetical protein
VLRARAKPETRNRASPCPSASTACGFGAQAFDSASAFNANIGAWNTARVTTLYQVCAAPGPGGVHYGGGARPGLRCGAARCVRFRRSWVRRRSTRTSARGTPRRSPRWTGYAPLPARAARTTADALGRASMRRGPVARGGTADTRARAHTCRHSLARGLGCRYGRPEGRFDACIRGLCVRARARACSSCHGGIQVVSIYSNRWVRYL